MILITGGTGYIGSHTCVALAQAGHELLILDNLSNSRADVVDRLQTIIGKRPGFIEGDSRARKSHRQDSDTDVAVLLHGSPGKFVETKLAMVE